MKKKFKVLIALVIIVAVAVGAYFLFGRGTDNKQIRAKVYDLNNAVIVDDENIFTKTNNTIKEMLLLITAKGYNIPEVKAYFTTYIETLSYYGRIKEEILDKAVFVNNVDTGKYFKSMNSSYENLVELYKEGDEYLKGTYYTVTDYSMHNKDFLIGFQNKFNNALKELNSFYYNAGMAFCVGVKDGFETNNLYRLKIGYYCNAVNLYITNYLENLENGARLKNIIVWKNDVSDVKTYIDNKTVLDGLYNDIKELNLELLLNEYAKGTITEYINGLDEKEKSIADKYNTFVIGG